MKTGTGGVNYIIATGAIAASIIATSADGSATTGRPSPTRDERSLLTWGCVELFPFSGVRKDFRKRYVRVEAIAFCIRNVLMGPVKPDHLVCVPFLHGGGGVGIEIAGCDQSIDILPEAPDG